MDDLFSLDGRINRLRYFGRTFVIVLIMYAIAIAVGFAIGASGGDPNIAGLVGAVIGLGATVVIAFQAVKRLHDLGRPGTHYWLLLIPLYNIYLGLVLLF